MDYYNILGINKGASKEEIKKAYERQVSKIKEEVKSESRAKAFIKLFDEAYEGLINLEKSKESQGKFVHNIDDDNYKTAILNSNEIQHELEKKNIAKKTGSRNKKSNCKSKGGNWYLDNKQSKEDTKRKEKREKAINEKNKAKSGGVIDWIILPIKLMVFPIIIVLSLLIVICKIIKVVSWVASKVIIVGAIASVSIHIYQIYMRQALQNNKLFIIAGGATVAAIFLPYILKGVLWIIEGINDKLKDFVF